MNGPELHNRHTIDDDTFSVCSCNDDCFEANKMITMFTILIKLRLRRAGINAATYEANFVAEIEEMVTQIQTGKFLDWYLNAYLLVLQDPRGRVAGEPDDDVLTLLVSNTIITNHGIQILEDIFMYLHAAHEFVLRAFAQGPVNSSNAYFDYSFQRDTTWFKTEMLTILLKTLPDLVTRVFLNHTAIESRPIAEAIQIISAIPATVAEVRYKRGWALEQMSDTDLFKVFSHLPPRTLIKLKGIDTERFLQVKARKILVKMLAIVESHDLKFDDSLLAEFLNDTPQLQHILDGAQGSEPVAAADFLRHIYAKTLLRDVRDKLQKGEYVYVDVVVHGGAANNPHELSKIIAILEQYKTPLAYLCCALLLTNEIPCYYNADKSSSDSESYVIKRYSDGINFYKLAAADPQIMPTCRHLLTHIKSRVKEQTYNASARFADFAQHVYQHCNILDAAPVLAPCWESFKRMPMEIVVYNPPSTIYCRI